MLKVLITGSKGQLGLEVSSQMKFKKNVELHLTDIDELDISRVDDVITEVRRIDPDLIINCAAYTAVDDCETNQEIAFKINAIGPRNLSIAALEVNARLVHISTDYVFNGRAISDNRGNIRPYNEFDCPDPQTIYGKSKHQGERFVQNITPYHYILRTAWLYGDGKNFVRTMLDLSKSKDAIRVVNDQYGTPTSTRELTRAILSLVDTDNYGLFHATCEGSCTWYEFTKEIFSIKGIKTRVDPITTEEYPRPAKRPAYSVLDNLMFRLTNGHMFNEWQDELRRYLAET
jgi:dTDP-4-dehydrorhamnose reductase